MAWHPYFGSKPFVDVDTNRTGYGGPEPFVRFGSELNNYHQKGTTIMHKQLLGNRPSLLRLAFPLTIVAVMCFAFLPLTNAVIPAPDGGYAGENTAEGTSALFSLTTGVWNTASGFGALKSNTTGRTNTATGHQALLKNLSGEGNTAVGAQALVNSTTVSSNIAVGCELWNQHNDWF